MHVRVLASPNPPANRSARFLKFASTSRSKSFDPLDFWWRNNRRATEKSEGELLLPFIDTVARSQTVRKVPPLESNGTTMKNLVLILTRRPVNNHRSRCYKPQLVFRYSSMLARSIDASTRRKSARDYRIWNIITDINTQRVLSFPIRQALPPCFSIKRSILSCKRKFPNWIHLQLHSNIPIFEKERKYKTSHPFPNRIESLPRTTTSSLSTTFFIISAHKFFPLPFLNSGPISGRFAAAEH